MYVFHSPPYPHLIIHFFYLKHLLSALYEPSPVLGVGNPATNKQIKALLLENLYSAGQIDHKNE